MRRKQIVAVVLIVAGVLAFAYVGIAHAARLGAPGAAEAGVAVGPASDADVTPILGALSLVSGLAVLFVSTQHAYGRRTMR